MSAFALQPHLDQLDRPSAQRFAFYARTQDDFTAWKNVLRAKLRRLLRIEGRTLPLPPLVQKLQAVEREGYIEEKFALDVGEGIFAPIYILVPKAPPPYKPIMVFHGHNPSVQYILGQYPTAEIAEERLAANNNYAQALAQAGYLVCAVEQRGFGERRTINIADKDYPWDCRHLSFEYLMHGRTLMGERVWDGMVATSYVLNRTDVVPGVLGCTGNSGGGTLTLYLMALDDRITAAVPGCCFCSYQASIMSRFHCECNYIPDLLSAAEMGDVAAMFAPKPLRFINGEHDPLFPVEATRQEYETVRRAYAIFAAEDRCSLAVHPGGHAYNHALSHACFKDWL
ncbi:MAG: alpha/beta hydrolase family protein [bacterium]|nr:alpha/beta hydrolase family protein [bacterium]